MQRTDLDVQDLLALRAIKGRLAHLKWLTSVVRLEFAMHRHLRALKYSADQPRVPRGYPDGGLWSVGVGFGFFNQSKHVRLAGDVPTNDSGKPPMDRPKTPCERGGWLNAAARSAAEQGTAAVEVAKLYPWMTYYASGMQSYNDPPRSLEELQSATPSPGYDTHHIVEQSQAGNEGYSREAIDSPDNLVVIPRMKHWEINQWYQTKNEEYGGETPRDYLSGRNWSVKREVGLEALRRFKVLSP